MAHSAAGVSMTTNTAAPTGASFVEWGAVWAGGAVAAALSFVLLSFASAIGLSFLSPWSGTAFSVSMIGSVAVFFAMVQQIGSAMAGGYVAGRMRAPWGEAADHEVEFRDGLHGGLVWAVGVIISAALLALTAGAVTRATASIAAGAASAVTAQSNLNPLEISVDMLFRKAIPAGTAASSANASPAGQSVAQNVTDQRAEVLRTFTSSIAHGTLADQDRTYLGSVVAQYTGLSQADAEKRVGDTFAEAINTAKDTANKIRRGSILVGLVTAASLLISLGAAWWAAQRGGHHRDNSVPASLTSNVRRTTYAMK